MLRLLKIAAVVSATVACCAEDALPKVWISCWHVADLRTTFADCRSHGVDVVETQVWPPERCREILSAARQTGVKVFVGGAEASEDHRPMQKGWPVERAVMIGGAYRGLSIDRHLFSFTATQHEIVLEPPVFSRRQPYVRSFMDSNGKVRSVRGGHYFEEFEPIRAEVIVPLAPFDGKAHVAVVPAEMQDAPPDTALENDSVTPDMAGTPEIVNRRLVKLSFDLSSYGGAMLDKVGVAVYWRTMNVPLPWCQRSAAFAPSSPHTSAEVRRDVAERLGYLAAANGGTFPSDVVAGFRFGDECFNVTGHLDSPACSYPLWDYSESALKAFRASAGEDTVVPRTWGRPEIYGARAYAIFLYEYHRACAGLARAAVEAVHGVAPGVRVFRNTTRGSAWSYANDHDGSSQELLARELDILHLDPYPVSSRYAEWIIPSDMAYLSGFSRRFRKPLMPWLQAHAYAPGGLCHVTPEDVVRMWNQHKAFAPDALMWLGYDLRAGGAATFPNGNKASWAKAAEVHAQVHAGTVCAKPKATLAVLRPYAVRALACETGNGTIRNPADALLGRFAAAWAVRFGRAYDVFELAPDESPATYAKELAQYEHVVSTIPYANAHVIGAGTEGLEMTNAQMLEAAQKLIAESGEWKLHN